MRYRGMVLRSLALLMIAAAVSTMGYTRYFRVPTNVAYVSEENDEIAVIDLKTLTIIRRVRLADIAPRGIGVTFAGKYIITANKDTSDVAVFSTPRLNLVRRMHVGDSPEFIKLDPGGDRFFA